MLVMYLPHANKNKALWLSTFSASGARTASVWNYYYLSPDVTILSVRTNPAALLYSDSVRPDHRAQQR